MDTIFPDLLRSFMQVLFLLGLVVASIWFWFRLRSVQQKQSPAITPPTEDKKIIITLKLQACERLILLLERINPSNLILRVHSTEMTAAQLQAALIRSVREEYDYNLSQQLYITSKTWELIRNAKEETIHLINTAASKQGENFTSRELAGNILQLNLARETAPVTIAIEALKREIN